MMRLVPPLQLPIPWTLRALVQRPLSRVEELLEVLSQDAEPLVADWARDRRSRVRDADDLVKELRQLEAEGGPVARSLAATVRSSWQEFAGSPLPGPFQPPAQRSLPLA